jgi:succinoglycan biosynthesis protein ExoM
MRNCDNQPQRRALLSVCIPTFQRPQPLASLLAALRRQECNGFHFEVVVVDNDSSRSAQGTVEQARAKSASSIRYTTFPVPNIAEARNTAIRSSSGDLIAFIDDGEVPTERWLLELFETWIHHRVAGVLGPVKPRYLGGKPPQWLLESRLAE